MLQDLVLQELATAHAGVQSLTRSKLQLKQDIKEARAVLQEELATSGYHHTAAATAGLTYYC